MNRSSHQHQGRAIAARPLLCLGAVLAVLSFAPAAALAELTPPVLTATNPPSPGASLTPRIGGVVEDSETKAVTLSPVLGDVGSVAQAGKPTNTVRIYTAADCTGPLAAEGTVEALEGAGLLVAGGVAADAVTLFYATQSDEAETSACSQGLRYRQVSTPPSTPVFTAVNPASPANQNLPLLSGSADPEATISIYTNGTCVGTPVASGDGAQFADPGIQVAVADNTETTFVAKASLAGFVSGCSGPISYAEVTPPPTPDPDPGGGGGGSGGDSGAAPSPPRIHTVPGGTANDNLPRVTGTAPGANAVRIYASPSCEGPVVAKGSPAELAAGIAVKVMDNATVALSATSVANQKASRCSDPVLYVEDSLTPRTRITMGPAAKTAKRKAVIRFTDTTGSAAGTAFFCKVDRKKWKRCSSPLGLGKLKLRRYTVRVKASDPAGNVEARGAKRTFRVIARP